MAWIKNIEHEKCLAVTDEVSYQPGQIVSKTLAQTRHHSLTLFAFDQGEAISTHESGGDAMVLGLDGQGSSPSTAGSTWCTPEKPSLCRPKSRTRCWQRSPSKCCLSSYFRRRCDYESKN